MARITTPEEYAKLVEDVREKIPDVAITTDVIAGFPGETEEEFNESLAFVRQMQFAHGHVFTYSARQDTAAATLPDQVAHSLRKQRNAQMREALTESRLEFQKSQLGSILPVLWERAVRIAPNLWELSGLTDNYLRVNSVISHNLHNQICAVKINSHAENRLLGQIL
jgi:threonylcarbamoyladenosine tRNA methylthiotransferase MtaB